LTLDSPGISIWVGSPAAGQVWIYPSALEIRTVDTSRVKPCSWKGPAVLVAASTDGGWVQVALAPAVAFELGRTLQEIATPLVPAEVPSC
jgi:hypothetical protein